MDETESDAQSFIVRVWVEERAEEADRGLWRGHITHVSSSRRRYLKNPRRDRRLHRSLPGVNGRKTWSVLAHEELVEMLNETNLSIDRPSI